MHTLIVMCPMKLCLGCSSSSFPLFYFLQQDCGWLLAHHQGDQAPGVQECLPVFSSAVAAVYTHRWVFMTSSPSFPSCSPPLFSNELHYSTSLTHYFCLLAFFLGRLPCHPPSLHAASSSVSHQSKRWLTGKVTGDSGKYHGPSSHAEPSQSLPSLLLTHCFTSPQLSCLTGLALNGWMRKLLRHWWTELMLVP